MGRLSFTSFGKVLLRGFIYPKRKDLAGGGKVNIVICVVGLYLPGRTDENVGGKGVATLPFTSFSSFISRHPHKVGRIRPLRKRRFSMRFSYLGQRQEPTGGLVSVKKFYASRELTRNETEFLRVGATGGLTNGDVCLCVSRLGTKFLRKEPPGGLISVSYPISNHSNWSSKKRIIHQLILIGRLKRQKKEAKIESYRKRLDVFVTNRLLTFPLVRDQSFSRGKVGYPWKVLKSYLRSQYGFSKYFVAKTFAKTFSTFLG